MTLPRKHAGVVGTVQCDSSQQLTGVWVRSCVKAKGLSEWLGGMDGILVTKLCGIAVSSQSRTCSQGCLHGVETLPNTLPKAACFRPHASDLRRETAGGETDGVAEFGLKTWQPQVQHVHEAVFSQ